MLRCGEWEVVGGRGVLVVALVCGCMRGQRTFQPEWHAPGEVLGGCFGGARGCHHLGNAMLAVMVVVGRIHLVAGEVEVVWCVGCW